MALAAGAHFQVASFQRVSLLPARPLQSIDNHGVGCLWRKLTRSTANRGEHCRSAMTPIRALSGSGDSSKTSTSDDEAEKVAPASTSSPSEVEARGRQEGFESDGEVSSLMREMTFAELCDEFECMSSPAIERTARQLAKDIHDMREERRNLTCYATSVEYKDPLRSFKGREKYKRPSWLRNALSNPSVSMLSMRMLSRSELEINWRLRGDFPVPGGNLDLRVTSLFELNQISGQVLLHKESWDLSGSLPTAALLFFSSRLAWSTVEIARDVSEAAETLSKSLDKESENTSNIYVDPRDPRKFFQEADPNGDLFQIGFVIALLYLLVRFLMQVI